jgi:hypothetical protein
VKIKMWSGQYSLQDGQLIQSFEGPLTKEGRGYVVTEHRVVLGQEGGIYWIYRKKDGKLLGKFKTEPKLTMEILTPMKKRFHPDLPPDQPGERRSPNCTGWFCKSARRQDMTWEERKVYYGTDQSRDGRCRRRAGRSMERVFLLPDGTGHPDDERPETDREPELKPGRRQHHQQRIPGSP